tara:strand:- start:8615 stop:9370 length:756 start_codon:yes stop_codon:yes gene_type:complete
MAPKWTIDNLNKLFILKAGITEIDVQIDLYSDWKEEYKLGVNSSFPPAMRSIGGDPVTATRDAGDTYFMINGWRIRPDEVNHTLNIDGNLFTDPAGFSPYVPTVGAFNVFANSFVSNLIDNVVSSVDQQTLTDIETAVTDMNLNGVDLKSINKSTLAAILLALAAITMARGTVSVVNSPTSVEVQFDDGFDPEAGDGIAGRGLLFTSGLNVRGGARIAAMDGQGIGDPLLTLEYTSATPPTPMVGDSIILV